MGDVIRMPKISDEDAQRLSRVFNANADLRMTQDYQINEFLKGLIAYINRCSMCHGVGEVNFEQANGWDEPCPTCRPTEHAAQAHEAGE